MKLRTQLAMAVTAAAAAAAAPVTAYASETGVITAMSEKVYMENSGDAAVLENILQGTSVKVILTVTDEAGDTWYYVRTDSGLEGYMPAGSVSIMQAADGDAQTAEEPQQTAEETLQAGQDNTEQDNTARTDTAQAEDVQETAQTETTEETEQTQATETGTAQTETTEETEQPTETGAARTESAEETEQTQTSEETGQTDTAGDTQTARRTHGIETFEVLLVAGILLCTAAIAILTRKIRQLLHKQTMTDGNSPEGKE